MAKDNEHLCKKEINRLFRYENGKLFWKLNSGSRGKAGAEAGCINGSGYRWVRISKIRYMVHRIVWIYFNGDIPPGKQIDHQNHIRNDNRIENLRVVDGGSGNMKNTSMPKNNQSGCVGVYWRGSSKKWQAQIVVDGKHRYLGSYSDFDGAVLARKSAEKKYGFHENHGSKRVVDYG